MSKDNKYEPNKPEVKEEKLSLSATDLKAMMAEATGAAVKAALEALKPPEPKKIVISPEIDAAMAGMDEEQKAVFLRQFGSGTCSECGQTAVKNRYACKGKHAQMVVFPNDEHWGRYFQGCFLNGAKYLSNGPGHMITVPADNDFAAQIQAWVEMEKTNAQGKKKTHRSGAISPHGTQGFIPFNGAGFR